MKAISLFTFILIQTSFQDLFDKSTCGKSKQCFVPCYDENPDTCFGVTSLAFRNVSGTYYLDIELFTRDFQQSGNYIALAFADHPEMWSSFVSECSSMINTETMTPKISYNNNRPENIRINGLTQKNMSKLLTNFMLTEVDGQILCKFTQQINNLPFNNDLIYSYKEGDEKYLLFARGATSLSGLTIHNYNEKVASTYKTKIGRIFGVDCPSGFDYFPEWQLCIGSTLKEGDGWTANEQSCFIEGGTLVIIHDAFYNSLIGTTALKRRFSDFDSGIEYLAGGVLYAKMDITSSNEMKCSSISEMGSYRVMIGLKKNESVWEWADGSTFDYQRWAPGEPSNEDGDEDCAYLDPNNNNNWYSGECFYLTNFLCQIPLLLSK